MMSSKEVTLGFRRLATRPRMRMLAECYVVIGLSAF